MDSRSRSPEECQSRKVGKSLSGAQEPPMLPMKCFSLTNISIALSSTLVVGTPTSTAVPPSALPKWPLLQAGTICSVSYTHLTLPTKRIV